jgi:hypothetical protein
MANVSSTLSQIDDIAEANAILNGNEVTGAYFDTDRLLRKK